MNEIFYRLVDLPLSVRGFTLQDQDGDYNVYVNQNLCPAAMERTIQHELEHIKSGDLSAEEYQDNDFGKK